MTKPVRLQLSRRKGSQFAGLRKIVQPLSLMAMILSPKIATLLKRQIVDHAAHARKLTEQDFLLSSRRKFVTKTANNHYDRLTPLMMIYK